MTKKLWTVILIAILVFATLFSLIWGLKNRRERTQPGFSDGTSMAETDDVFVTSNHVKVRFSDVLLSRQNETRKLIVSTQTGTVSTKLTAGMIDKVYWKAISKNQTVTYNGTGYFVVDLDHFKATDILQNETKHTVTILIDHAYLEAIDIDPNNVMIDEVQKGILAWGDIKLSMEDYNTIEKELRQKLEDQFDTAKNAQQADDLALKMVKKTFEPLVKAIDDSYEVLVAFG